ncbi:hypothetical protein KVF89_27980 [Nocardioides carbamazepini]|uniref:hypothetical protein n=1 Tax=Nocardioides carbamazepini TaxID=2854259 RepID=UPI00214A0198|nr:hypothetical protein [Nocardioides carbamazepini]MCR1786405.1 hypothetical protein [Nocardioides carbamazepini]
MRPAVVAVLVALTLLLTACGVVAEPDAAAWDERAARALSDAGSQVATARLALESADEERTWSAYATVLVAQAEEAAGKAAEDLSRVQVPTARADDAADVLDLLDQAVDLVGEARAHSVDGEYDDQALLDALDRLADELRRAAP